MAAVFFPLPAMSWSISSSVGMKSGIGERAEYFGGFQVLSCHERKAVYATQ